MGARKGDKRATFNMTTRLKQKKKEKKKRGSSLDPEVDGEKTKPGWMRVLTRGGGVGKLGGKVVPIMHVILFH